MQVSFLMTGCLFFIYVDLIVIFVPFHMTSAEFQISHGDGDTRTGKVADLCVAYGSLKRTQFK